MDIKYCVAWSVFAIVFMGGCMFYVINGKDKEIKRLKDRILVINMADAINHADGICPWKEVPEVTK